MTKNRTAPEDYTEFDRTVRGMLNRLSVENASRLLPLAPSLRGADDPTGDCPPWWAARFAVLMLGLYLQVINTNRFARGLALRSSDNVLPEYLDAVAPLLVQSPRLVNALMALLARLLRWYELQWPTTRLMLIAARHGAERREELPPGSLGLLPAELITGRILGFLQPQPLPAIERIIQSESVAQAITGEERDTVAVLAHVLMFCPAALWPRLSAFGFSLLDASLLQGAEASEEQLYLAGSLLATIALRIEAQLSQNRGGELLLRHIVEDAGPMRRLAAHLRSVLEQRGGDLSQFVACRVQVALDRTARMEERLKALSADQTRVHADDLHEDPPGES